MKNRDITVGFEVECLYQEGEELDEHLDCLDECGEDGSISNHCSSENYETTEIITSPLRYDSIGFHKMFDQLQKMIDKDIIRFNDSCGLHFHMRFDPMQPAVHALGSGKFI